MNAKSLVGKRVSVTFHDHAENSSVILCEIPGAICTKEDNLQIELTVWDISSLSIDDINFNREKFSILKSAILSIHEIKKGRSLIGYIKRNNKRFKKSC